MKSTNHYVVRSSLLDSVHDYNADDLASIPAIWMFFHYVYNGFGVCKVQFF